MKLLIRIQSQAYMSLRLNKLLKEKIDFIFSWNTAMAEISKSFLKLNSMKFLSKQFKK